MQSGASMYKIKDIACHDTTFETTYIYFTKDKVTFAIIFLDNVHSNKRLKNCNNWAKNVHYINAPFELKNSVAQPKNSTA